MISILPIRQRGTFLFGVRTRLKFPVKTKDYEKLKLEKEKTKNSQNPSSNKAFIDQEDEQLIQKARQRLKEQGSIRVRIEDL